MVRSPGLRRTRVGTALLFIGVIAGIGWAVIRGRPLRPRMASLLLSGCAGIAGLGLSELLKLVIGRTPVFPDFVVQGTYRFAPLHQGFGSFPSTTAATVSAVVGIMWMAWPRGRAAYALLLLTVGVVIVLVNAHWLSDVLAGVFVGRGVATAVLAAAVPAPVPHPA